MSNTQSETKSIEDLKKELHRVYKESSVKIKNEIKKTNETYNHALEDFNRNLKNDEKFKFNESFTKIQEKIKLINSLIDILDNRELKSYKIMNNGTPIEMGKVEKEKKIIEGTQSQLNVKNVKNVKNYIKYFKYLRDILQTKVIKDVKIMNLFNAVMNNTNEIVEAIKKIKAIMDKEEAQRKKEEAQRKEQSKQSEIRENKRKKKEELLECSKGLKDQLKTISELTEIKYDKDIIKKIKKNEMKNALNNCSVEIAQNLKDLINSVENIKIKQKGGGTMKVLDITDIIDQFNIINNTTSNTKKSILTNNIKGNTNQRKYNNYTTQLKDIKKTYEDGLKQNIEDFKTICKALKDYLNNLFKIILDLLKPKSKPQQQQQQPKPPQPQPQQQQLKPPQPQPNTNEDALKKIKKLKETKMSELEQIRPILHKLEKDLSDTENKMKENDKKKEEYIKEIKSEREVNSSQMNALRSHINVEERKLEELLFNLDVKLKRLGINIDPVKFLKIIKSGDHKNMKRLIEYIKNTEGEKNQQEEEIKDKKIDNLQDYLNILNEILSNFNNNSKKTSSIRRSSLPEISSQERNRLRKRAKSNVTQIDKEKTEYLKHLTENKSLIYAEIIAKIELLIENLNNEIKENNTPKSDEILNNIMVIINVYDLIEKLDIEYKESHKIKDQRNQKIAEKEELLQGTTIEQQNAEETLKLMINIKQILLKYVRFKKNIYLILEELEEKLEEGNLEPNDLDELKREYKKSVEKDIKLKQFKDKLSHNINIFKNEMAEFEDLETSWNKMYPQINNN